MRFPCRIALRTVAVRKQARLKQEACVRPLCMRNNHLSTHLAVNTHTRRRCLGYRRSRHVKHVLEVRKVGVRVHDAAPIQPSAHKIARCSTGGRLVQQCSTVLVAEQLLRVAQKLLLRVTIRGRLAAVDRLVGPRLGHLPPKLKQIAVPE